MYLPWYSDSASMARQSAPACTAAAPTCASTSGLLPYTYCHAHARRPWACSVATSDRLNCDHAVEPSPALTNSVLTPLAWAVAMIERRLPPLEAETYQIHMPRPANGLPRAAAPAGSASAATASV